jgi:hypothetical protein
MLVVKKVAPPGLVIYLDFDGVLHHESVMWHARKGIYMCPKQAPGRVLFEWIFCLEEVLAPYPEAKLVLSSSWCIRPGYGSALKRLPKHTQDRFVGGTYHRRHHGADDWSVESFKALPRGLQILNDVQRRRPEEWLALDDDAEGWPELVRDRLVLCEGTSGLSSSGVQAELKQKLELCSGRIAHGHK